MCVLLIQTDTMFGEDDFFSQMSFAHACLTVDAEPFRMCFVEMSLPNFGHFYTSLLVLSSCPADPFILPASQGCLRFAGLKKLFSYFLNANNSN